MYRSKSKGSAFHVMKPCIEFMQGFFFVLIKLKIVGEEIIIYE